MLNINFVLLRILYFCFAQVFYCLYQVSFAQVVIFFYSDYRFYIFSFALSYLLFVITPHYYYHDLNISIRYHPLPNPTHSRCKNIFRYLKDKKTYFQIPGKYHSAIGIFSLHKVEIKKLNLKNNVFGKFVIQVQSELSTGRVELAGQLQPSNKCGSTPPL